MCLISLTKFTHSTHLAQYNDDSSINLQPMFPFFPLLYPPQPKKPRRWTTFSTILLAMIIVAVGAVIAISLVVLHRYKSNSSGSPSPPPFTGATSGTNGSVVTTNNGSTFIYINNFGGDWAYDPQSPFEPGGKAQSWSPRVGNETWNWGSDVARGVNLG